MKNFVVNLKRVKNLIEDDKGIRLYSIDIGPSPVRKTLRKNRYKTVSGNISVKRIDNKDIKNIRVGDLYFSDDDILDVEESIKKR